MSRAIGNAAALAEDRQQTNRLLHSAFFRNAALYPDAACIEYRGRTYSYGECRVRAERVARNVAPRIAPGQSIALIAERGPAMVWGMLGAARMGAVFTVIDAAYPEGRIAELLEIARPALILSSREIGEICAAAAPEIVAGDRDAAVPASPADPAYYLFTSGSTGRPRCVACSHEPLVRFVRWQADFFDLKRGDRFSMLSGLSHDPVLRDIFTPLSIGAAIVIPGESDIREPGALGRFLAAKRISVAHLTPSMGSLLVAGKGSEDDLPDMRHFFWGGDRLPGELVGRVARLAPRAQQTNFYGSTETPQAVAFHRISLPVQADPVPIGRGAAGHRVEIIDGPEGGQIAIRSRHLSLGYVEEGRIVQRTGRADDGGDGDLYLTGDLGHRLESGDVVVTGRLDDQVKIRGFRVDPSEIASQLAAHPCVAEACALPIRHAESVWLACFVAWRGSGVPSEQEVQAYLAARLPSYMLPRQIFILGPALPLLANGKPDRQAMTGMALAQGRVDSGDDAPMPTAKLADLDPRVSALIASWAQVLQRSDVTPASTFNDLDGDSLSYVQAYMALEEIAGTVPEDWQDMPIARLVGDTQGRPGPVARIESVIVLRALSMVALVALHAELTNLGNGVTAALFMVSGYLFGKSEWDAMFRPDLASRMLGPIKSLLPLTALFSVASSVLATLLLGHPFSWPSALLFADLLDFPPGSTIIRSSVIYWYLHSLLKLLMLTFVLQWAVGRFFRSAASQFAFVCAAAAMFFAVRLAMPHVVSPQNLEFTPTSLRVFQTNPLATIPLFYIGIALSAETGRGMRLAMLAAIAGLAMLNVPIFGFYSSVFIAATAFIILFMREVPVPRVLAKPVFMIAASSLYIYLVHTWVDRPLQALTPDAIRGSIVFPVLVTVAGIVSGIALMAALERARIHWRQDLAGLVRRFRPHLVRGDADKPSKYGR